MNKAKTEGVSEELQGWLDSISTYEREFKKWEGRVEKILKRYRDEQRDKTSESRFNILWSNVQTLVPATFSRLPIPDVTRRFKDNDPVGRVAALILERALDFEIQHYQDYRTTLDQGVHDRFLGGRATAWVRYEPHFKALQGQSNDGVQITEDQDKPEIQEQLDYECTPVDYVHWKDFGHNVARTWEEVTQVWRKVYMSEPAVLERFGEDWAKRISYDQTPEELKRSGDSSIPKKQALIYELWDKEQGVAVWIAKGIKDVLDSVEDPLGLQDFFPCPKPLFATLTNESLIPVPDFTLYQDQANALDILADRIHGLAQMLQLKGVYDAATPELARLFTEGNNGSLIATKNYAAFAEKGGLAGAIDLVDLTMLAKAMQVAQETMEQLKDQVYEITGISDIVRGQTKASETATAQNIKGQYASLRLKDKQQGVAEFATSILRLKAQVMCRKFDPKTLAAMAAVEQLTEDDKALVPEALALLVGKERMLDPSADAPNPMRSFRIEIAADTLVELDEQQEKQDRMEFLTANGTFMEKAIGMMSQAGPAAPILAPVIMELWKFGITGFKVGKSVEGTLDMAADKLKELAQQPQPQQPNPDLIKIQAQQQSDQARLAHDQQVAQQQALQEQQSQSMEAQREQAKEQAIAVREERDAQLNHQREMAKMKFEYDSKNAENTQKAQSEAASLELDRWKAELDASTKITVAEIAAKASQDNALIAAESAANAEVNKDLGGSPAKRATDTKKASPIDKLADMHKASMDAQGKTLDSIAKLAEGMARPRKTTLVRGSDGKPSHGISEIQ